MAWDIKFDEAMAQAKRDGIPPEDAAKMWGRYNELGAAVRAGTLSDEAALSQFAAFCSGLATIRKLGEVFQAGPHTPGFFGRPTPAGSDPDAP